jgi:hypothetical protein
MRWKRLISWATLQPLSGNAADAIHEIGGLSGFRDGVFAKLRIGFSVVSPQNDHFRAVVARELDELVVIPAVSG